VGGDPNTKSKKIERSKRKINMVNKKKRSKKKKVCEIVKIEKDGKEEVKKICGTEEEKPASQKQINTEKKQLKTILIVLGIIVIAFVIVLLINYKATHFKYEELKFNMVKEGDIIFYKVPVTTLENGEKTGYNFYLRTNPNKLKKIPFDGEITLRNNLILNVTTENLFCGGDWQLAIGNLMLLDIFGINVLADETLGCEENSDYIYVNIHEGNESRIEQFGSSCYNLYIADCEILQVTEKFMAELFLKINEYLEG
jgi:hypothetical protein